MKFFLRPCSKSFPFTSPPFRFVLWSLLLLPIFFAAAPVSAGESKTLCLVIDQEPALLSLEARGALRKGLCSFPGALALPVDREKRLGFKLFIFSKALALYAQGEKEKGVTLP